MSFFIGAVAADGIHAAALSRAPFDGERSSKRQERSYEFDGGVNSRAAGNTLLSLEPTINRQPCRRTQPANDKVARNASVMIGSLRYPVTPNGFTPFRIERLGRSRSSQLKPSTLLLKPSRQTSTNPRTFGSMYRVEAKTAWTGTGIRAQPGRTLARPPSSTCGSAMYLGS